MPFTRGALTLSRVSLLLVVLACLFVVQTTWASQPDFHLQVVPANVYKVDDPGNTKTSSFVFDIAVISSTDCALTPISSSVELSNGRSTVERQEWTAELLAKIKRVNYRVLPDTPVWSPKRTFILPEAFCAQAGRSQEKINNIGKLVGSTCQPMQEIAEYISVLACALFTGASVYMTFIEHPARIQCGAEIAATEFAPSYRRATVMQATCAAVGLLSSVAAWLAGAAFSWLFVTAPPRRPR